MTLTPALAVEKVLYRLALIQGGSVAIARAFLELPLSLEQVEQHADLIADGRSVVRNDFGEFLSYDFPELQQQLPSPPDDCPLCFGEAPGPTTEAGVEQRAALLCATCYRSLQRIQRTQPDETNWAKLAHFFRGEEEDEDLERVARIEHEIFYLALRSGLPQFTHTTIAAQSRLPGEQIKERLDRMSARRYLKVGLLPSGDAVAYRAPHGLTYPSVHYERLTGKPARPSGKLNASEIQIEKPSEASEPPAPRIWPSVRATPRSGSEQAVAPEPAPEPEPPKPALKITIKPRQRPS